VKSILQRIREGWECFITLLIPGVFLKFGELHVDKILQR
jgi:hypothetical protein